MATPPSSSCSPAHQTPCPCHALTGSRSDQSPPAIRSAGTPGTPDNPLCPSCVTSILEPHWQRRSEVRTKHGNMKAWCSERLDELRHEDEDDASTRGVEEVAAEGSGSKEASISATSLSRLKYQSDALRTKLDNLRLICGEQSVKVAALAFRNDERQQRLQVEQSVVQDARNGLDQIWVGVLGGGGEADDVDYGSNAVEADNEDRAANDNGDHADNKTSQDTSSVTVEDGLPGAISSLVSEVRTRRLALALRAFDAHRIDIGPDCSNAKDDETKDDKKEAATSGKSCAAVAASSKEGTFDDDKDETGAKERTAARQERMRRRPRGVGKVCGLPLPHAGPALYGVLPPAVLASSLRLVASLTVTLSRCLGIEIPHPILLRPLIAGSSSSRSKGQAAAALARAQRKQCGDIVESVKVDEMNLDDMLTLPAEDENGVNNNDAAAKKGSASIASNGSGNASGNGSQTMLSSASSIRSLGRTARWAFGMATGYSSSEGVLPSSSSSMTASATNSSSSKATIQQQAPPSYSNLSSSNNAKHRAPVDASVLAARIRHSSAAVIWEGSDGTGGEYALIPPGWTGAPVRSSASSLSDGLSPEDEFATGLQLLQNDVIALCIRAGVQVGDMWPAEALLLNLDALRIHLHHELTEQQVVCA